MGIKDVPIGNLVFGLFALVVGVGILIWMGYQLYYVNNYLYPCDELPECDVYKCKADYYTMNSFTEDIERHDNYMIYYKLCQGVDANGMFR